jgi:hypothetical protein
MEVAWSKVGAMWRMLEDFPLEISQRLICLVRSMGTRVVMQEQQCKSIFQISTLICLSFISICNLLIDLPT